MSTHLQVLPKLRSSSVSKPIAAGKENSNSNTATTTNNIIIIEPQFDREIGENNRCKKKKIVDEVSNKLCLTPKSAKSRIPQPLTCPPAPRKPTRRAAVSCKRKLIPEFDFFETDRRGEVDEFFRSSFERISTAQSTKRKAASAAAAAAACSSSSSSSSSSPTSPAKCN